MEQKELVKQLRDFLKDKESVDGNAAPALHLMRHALVARERPVVEVHQDILEDNHEAEVLRDQLAEREGFLYGLLGELQLIPEVDGEPVDTLADAIAEDITILESLHGEVVNLFTRWNESPDTARDREKFIAAVCALLNLPSGTPLLDIWHALEAKAQYLASLERGIANGIRPLRRWRIRMVWLAATYWSMWATPATDGGTTHWIWPMLLPRIRASAIA